MPPAQTAVFEDVDLLAGAITEIAAHETGDGPANGGIGAAEVQEVLLRLVRGDQHGPLLRERVLTPRFGAEQALEGMDPGAGAPPFFVVHPLEFLFHGLRHTPAMGKAELREHRTGGGQAEIVHEILTQEPHGYGIEQERALPGKADDSSFRVQLEELIVVQIFHAHGPPPSY
jgi:hypothetical protein